MSYFSSWLFLSCCGHIKSAATISGKSQYLILQLGKRKISTGKLSRSKNFPERQRYYQILLGYERGPLTNLPDYSNVDGSPVPLTGGRREERIKQMEYAKKIICFLKEVDGAVEFQQQSVREKERLKQQVLDERLRPKGNLLLEEK